MNVAGYLSSGYPFEQDEFASETDPYIGRTVSQLLMFFFFFFWRRRYFRPSLTP